MSSFHLGWFLLGVLVWVVATAALWFLGPFIFERGLGVWMLCCTGIVLSFVGLYILIERFVTKTPIEARLASTASFAVGGMIGEIPILLLFDRLMTRMEPGTAGAYGAFLFAGYVALLAYTTITAPGRHSHG